MRRPWAIVLVALVVSVVACTDVPDVGSTAADDDVLEVFTNYQGADADAFRDVLAAFSDDSGVPTRHVGTSSFAVRLSERLRDGDRPDVALIPQPALLAEVARQGHTVRLEDMLDDQLATMRPSARDLGMVDGDRHGVWFRTTIKSLLWYAPAAVEEAGQAVPGNLDALLGQSNRLAAEGPTPWCVGIGALDATGWAATDWIEDLVLRLHGPEVYDAWVEGRIAFTDPRIRQAFEVFADLVLTEGAVRGGERAILGTPVLDAIDGMLEDPPRCLFTRQGSYQREALPPGTTVGLDGDVAAIPFPGVGDEPPPLVAAGELAAAFNDDEGTQALVAYLAGPDSGRVWAANHDGYLSPHEVVDPTAYQSAFSTRMAELLADAEVLRFDGSDQMEPAVGTGTFWSGMVDLVAGLPVADVLDGIQAGYDDADEAETPGAS